MSEPVEGPPGQSLGGLRAVLVHQEQPWLEADSVVEAYVRTLNAVYGGLLQPPVAMFVTLVLAISTAGLAGGAGGLAAVFAALATPGLVFGLDRLRPKRRTIIEANAIRIHVDDVEIPTWELTDVTCSGDTVTLLVGLTRHDILANRTPLRQRLRLAADLDQLAHAARETRTGTVPSELHRLRGVTE
ncbi:MAG: hypothetical protein KC912_18220 [Proteobacteria bacterium]|nr:hypothetical protein [Pseudomonadota bacterium]